MALLKKYPVLSRACIFRQALTFVASILIDSQYDLEAERVSTQRSQEEQRLVAERKAQEEARAKSEKEARDAAERATLAASGFATMAELQTAREKGFGTKAEYDVYLRQLADEQRRAADEEKRRAEEKRLAEEQEEKQKCKAELQCWGDKYLLKASFACDDLIPKMAKFTYEWTDSIFEPKLSMFRWKDAKKGTVTYLGDKIRFQNGFGAWQDIIYECDYNPFTETIMDVRVRPGRL
jgi:hypothetical protein